MRRFYDFWQTQDAGSQFFLVAIVGMLVAFIGAANGLTDWSIFALLFSGIVAVLAIWGLILWCVKANNGDKAAIMGLYLLWGMPGVMLAITGLALITNGHTSGKYVLISGLGMSLPLLKSFRKAVAKVIPIDPDSAIDYSGLAVILGLIGILLYTAMESPAPKVVEKAGAAGFLGAILSQLIAFVVVAYLVVGYKNHRTAAEATERLGISRPTFGTWKAGLAGIPALFVSTLIGSLLTQVFQPDVVSKLQDTLKSVSGDVTNPALAIIFALCAGIGEETFFRGALQPRFGIVLTSVLFALLHAQYGLTWTLFGLFLMGVVLGVLRKRYGTVAAIIAHTVYNLIVVVIQVWVV